MQLCDAYSDDAIRQPSEWRRLHHLIDYNYDAHNQLLGADYAGDWQADEGYVYDENGNRITATGSSYETGLDNRLTSDGTFNYVYDGEGNRTARFTDVNDNDLLDSGDTDITEYEWDHRNRLVEVTERDVFGGQSTQVVTHTYDAYDQWLTRTVDPDGESGAADLEKTVFVHDDGQIVMQFDGTGAGDLTASDLTHRYLWGPGIDQLVADEQIADVQSPGEVLWALADHQGTVRDVVDENGTVRLHLQYDAFGVVTGIDYFDSQGNAISAGDAEAVEWHIRHTGLYFDDSTGLLQNRARWRELETNQFLSEDPIKDGYNWRIYVGNSPLMYTDPSGLEEKRPSNWLERFIFTEDFRRNALGHDVPASTKDPNVKNTGDVISETLGPIYGHGPYGPDLGTWICGIKDSIYGGNNGFYGPNIWELIGDATRPGREAFTGRDAEGRKLTPGARITEAAKQAALVEGVRRALTPTVAPNRGLVRGANPSRVVFNGMEVRAVRNLSHVDDSTLRAMAQHGFAAKDINGKKLILHHLDQNPAGPIVEIPGFRHSIGNRVQHPLGNAAGAGLTAEQRAAFNAWRTEYWKTRALEELTRRGLTP